MSVIKGVCIKNSDILRYDNGSLIIGQVYDIIESRMSSDIIYIDMPEQNGHGTFTSFPSSWFIPLEDYRDTLINNILG